MTLFVFSFTGAQVSWFPKANSTRISGITLQRSHKGYTARSPLKKRPCLQRQSQINYTYIFFRKQILWRLDDSVCVWDWPGGAEGKAALATESTWHVEGLGVTRLICWNQLSGSPICQSKSYVGVDRSPNCSTKKNWFSIPMTLTSSSLYWLPRTSPCPEDLIQNAPCSFPWGLCSALWSASLASVRG